MQLNFFRRGVTSVLWLLAWNLWAHDVNLITDLAVTNSPTNFVIAADIPYEATSGFNRGAIHATALVYFATTNAAPVTYDYEMVFRLLNQTDSPVPVLNSAGTGPTNEFVVPTSVTLPYGFVAFFTNYTGSYSARLEPQQRLSPYDRYHVDLQLRKRLAGGGVFAATGSPTNTAPQQYYHFTNTVPTGDAARNTIAEVRSVNWGKKTAVRTIGGRQTFSVVANCRAVRFDEFGGLLGTSPVDVRLAVELRDAATAAVVPLVNGVTNFAPFISHYVSLGVAPYAEPSVVNGSVEIFFEPDVQLDPVNRSYLATVTISHNETTNTFSTVIGNAASGDPAQLLHLSGNLNFGSVATRLTALDADPGAPILAPPYQVSALGISSNGGYVINHPTHLLAGGIVGVNVDSAGDAFVTSGTVAINAPAFDADTNHNVIFFRAGLTLNNAGAHASNIVALLPTGLGFRADTNADVLDVFVPYGGMSLNGSLSPGGVLTLATNVFLCEESKPLWFAVPDITWAVDEGAFHFTPLSVTYVRIRQIMALVTAPADVLDKGKFSNELLFGAVNGFAPGAPLIARAGDNGDAQLTTRLTLGAGYFGPHFPIFTGPIWFASGEMDIADDLIVASNSVLNGVVDFYGAFARNCADGTNCLAPGSLPISYVKFVPTGGQLHISRDAGLVGGGSLLEAPPYHNTIAWGTADAAATPVHRVIEAFPTARYCMAGSFLRGGDYDDFIWNGTGQLLFSGVSSNNINTVERPNSAAYADGFGDYPGFNLRACNSHNGHSTIAGSPTVDYPLTSRSKYYLRLGGVSGIHEAPPGTMQLAPGGATYAFSFSTFSLAYLDNENVDSRTAGDVHIPGVASGGDPGFDLAFEKMELTCNGGLGEVELGSASLGSTNHLVYWNTDVIAGGLKFVQPDKCDPSSSKLVLGVTANAALVTTPLYGELGFLTTGHLTTTNDGYASFLQVPNNLSLHGKTGGDYPFLPTRQAYLNNARLWPGAAATGFLNIAGGLDVPFFENLPVHVHTQAKPYDTSLPLYVMDAFPDDDLDQVGFFPTNSTPSAFRLGTPHAKRDWVAGIHFDYPLKWTDSSRSFRSPAPENDSFVVLDVQHEVKRLDASNAELDFGIKSDGLPQINLVNLAADATGISAKMSEAIGAATTSAMEAGLAQFDDILNPLAATILAKPVASLCDPVSDALYDELAALPSGSWNFTIQNRCLGSVEVGTTNIFYKLQTLASEVEGATNLTADLQLRLVQVQAGLTAVSNVVNNVPMLIAAAQKILELVPGGLGVPSDLLQSQFTAAESARAEILSALADVSGKVKELQDGLDSGNEFASELATMVSSRVADLNSAATGLESALNSKINSVTINADVESFAAVYTREQFRQLVRDTVVTQLGAKNFSLDLQTILRERLYDLNASARQAVDSSFQQVNDVVRDAVSSATAELDSSYSGMLGAVNSVMRAGQINGYAHINGDSLDELRLDLKVQMDVPSELDLHAWLRIKSLKSDGPSGCGGGSPSDPATEIILGAESSKLDWIMPNLAGKMETKFTLSPANSPVGVAGKLEITGGLNFEAFSVDSLSAFVAFGASENYLAASAKLTFQSYAGAGGFFFGRTCTTDPLSWDPEVAAIVGTPPFTGVYVFGEAWVPVSEALLGIPATCFFRVDANVGCGMGYFLEGPTFIGRAKMGLSGRVLCIVSASASANLVGVANPSGVSMSGSGEFCATIGVWPAEFDICKTAHLKYQNKSWSVDF